MYNQSNFLDKDLCAKVYIHEHDPLFQKYQHTARFFPSSLQILNLTFIVPWIANIFSEYNQQAATFLNLFISVRRSTCFRRVFSPSGAQNCTYSVRHLSDQSHKCPALYVQFWAPDEGRKTRLKHEELLTEINKLGKVASCWLYSENRF